MAALAALLAGCKRQPEIRSIRKLDGAPALVSDIQFAPDGASVLVLERRPPKDESPGKTITYAVSRRPVAGGPAKDLIATDSKVIKFAPLGDGIVTLQHPSVPPANDALNADDEDHRILMDLAAAHRKTALYRVGNDGAPVRVSSEYRRCSNVVGSEGGQWVAFSTMPSQSNADDPERALEEEDVHVLGAKSGEAIPLDIKGSVRGISPDGSRVLVRVPGESDPSATINPMWFNRVKALRIVTVKDQTAAKVPAWIDVDGRRVHTEKLFVRFAGDGLLFWPEEGGDRYRSALDGSKGRHITLAPPNAGAPPAASSSAAPAASANKPLPSQLVLSLRSVFRLSEEEGAVVLSSLTGKPGEIEPIAKLEGPLAAFREGIVDAAEKRLAFAILSDTSRDGVLDEEEDSAEVFVTDAAPGSLSFGRAPVTLLADELKPKIAAAAGIPEASVSSLHDAGGALKVTADLPWIEGEKAKALLDRARVAARAISLQVTSLDASINLRVGPLQLKVHRPSKDADGRPHVALMARGILVDDREAIPLVLHKPTRTTITSFSSATMVMLSGELENTGKTTTSPIEAFMVPSGAPAAPFSFSFPPQRLEVFRQHLGGIEPGKRASFSLTGNLSGGWVGPKFRSDGGKRVKVFNQYTYDHAVGWLDTALAIRAGHGVWSEHGDELVDAHQRRVLVHLTAEQAALPEAARDALFRTIAKALRGHHEKFHGGQENYPLRVTFEAPGGGGWRMGEGKEIDRFEGKEEPSPKP